MTKNLLEALASVFARFLFCGLLSIAGTVFIAVQPLGSILLIWSFFHFVLISGITRENDKRSALYKRHRAALAHIDLPLLTRFAQRNPLLTVEVGIAAVITGSFWNPPIIL